MCMHLCVWVYLFIFANSACVHVLTFGTGYVLVCTNHNHHMPVHIHVGAACFEVEVDWGLLVSNHMSKEGGSSGSRPGLEGNQQHMKHI